jgi:hypothetical protein
MNRHVKTAFFIAPFLFLGGYLGTEFFMNKQVEVAKKNLELRPQPGCNLAQAPCVMAHETFSISIQASQTQPSVMTLGLDSNEVLHTVVIELLGNDGSSTGARNMQTPGDHKHWLVDLPGMSMEQPDHLRIALSTTSHQYYGTMPVRP